MSARRPRLVVAEPDRFMRESLCVGLGNTFEITQVSCGSELSAAFTRENAEAVLSCMELPDRDAASICAEIRNVPEGGAVPFYIYHFDDDEILMRRAFACGASDFLVQPVHLGILLQRMMRDIAIADRMACIFSGPLERSLVDGELFRQLPVPSIVADANGRVMLANPVFERLFERKAFVIGRPVAELLCGVSAGDFEKEAIVTGRLSCPRRGEVPVSVSYSSLREGPWKGCSVYYMQERSKREESQARVVHAANSARILVLEDHDLVARSLRRLLEKMGHRVCLASSAVEATEQMSAAIAGGASFDLAMLDVSVPGSAGGADVLKALKMMAPQLLAIVTSGSWNDPVMMHPVEFGFNAALRKPFSRNELSAVVNRVLAERIK